MTLPGLRLTNTLTRRKDAFAPIDPGHVRLYACGPTVYDFAHIGNARPVIVFDVLFRLLRLYAESGAFDGGAGETRVTYVRNITDVDDKINARAAADFPGLPLNDAIRRVTEGTERQFHEDIRALGTIMPDDLAGGRHAMVEPRATAHVEAMRTIIDRLVASDHAYAAEGNVLFHVPSMADYGALSRRPLDEMEAGARVDVAPYKRSPLDFVLWKPSGPDEPGWPSPAGLPGLGRPGWHIECSAMAWQHLGERFDIHAGGLDLIFPHHENEIAQSRCAFGTASMANVWLHNGFVQVAGEKMSKSLGNFVTIRDLLATDAFGGTRWHGAVLRFAMLGTHYRQPIDFTVERLTEARAQLGAMIEAASGLVPSAGTLPAPVLEALADDLNTPLAIAALHRLLKAARGGTDPAAGQALADSLAFLGLWRGESAGDVVGAGQGPSADAVEPLLAARAAARASKDWAASDRIRDELKAMGVAIKDNKDGTTTWDVAR